MGLTGIYGQVSTGQARDTLRAAFEAGVTLYDTAPLYGLGTNEELLGSVFGNESSVAIVTKFGLYADAKGILTRDSHPNTIRASVEGSLRRLKRECVDLLLQHRPDPAIPDCDVAEVVATLIDEGKVKSFGLSCADADRVRTWAYSPGVYAVQNELSLSALRGEAEPKLMASAGAVFMAFAPLGRGLLTRSRPSIDGDLRIGMMKFRDAASGSGTNIVEVVSEVAEGRGVSNAQIALAWLLSSAPNIVVIPGCKSRSHIGDIMPAAELLLSKEENDRIEAALRVVIDPS